MNSRPADAVVRVRMKGSQNMTETSLYELLGGALPSPRWSTNYMRSSTTDRRQQSEKYRPARMEQHNLAASGLKLCSLGVCNVAGPFQYTATKPGSTTVGLEAAHRDLKISPAQFDEVAAELGRTLAVFKVPQPETDEVLAAFAAHKGEVTEGYTAERAQEPAHS